jgi:hypothetical protein
LSDVQWKLKYANDGGLPWDYWRIIGAVPSAWRSLKKAGEIGGNF